MTGRRSTLLRLHCAEKGSLHTDALAAFCVNRRRGSVRAEEPAMLF